MKIVFIYFQCSIIHSLFPLRLIQGVSQSLANLLIQICIVTNFQFMIYFRNDIYVIFLSKITILIYLVIFRFLFNKKTFFEQILKFKKQKLDPSVEFSKKLFLNLEKLNENI